ncbi:glycoside hydrolase family 25 protein [Amycolatopsis dendrobii]|uniref:Glycoside hydrolase family 25 protein n=1 Tax=Amycolatopsis dendrobii TaxID=2760662 RepID=A0A7W3VUQ1_9PSEU|nr:glycoside hydrolase family 25 protein [Amycolatopsis dendrobii]MBB1153533.1 glycoside hydrolase family 25 protein [Amycolatopsis dendrobii]
MPLIIDLYQKYNPVGSWSALRGAVDGAYIKYSDGNGPAQVTADAYVSGCNGAGIPYGGYHFAEAGDPVRQADVLIDMYRRYGGQLAPALDLETGGIPVAQRPAFARAFLERVHTVYPRVVLYASTSWLAGLNPDRWPYDWDVTWAADYGPNNGRRNAIRHYGGRVDLHQFTSTGRAAGTVGAVDLSYTADLAALFLPTAAETENDDMPAIPYTFDGTGRDGAGQLKERCHVFTIPVGSVSAVVGRAWLSFKCGIGPAERVRLMAIAGGPKASYTVDKTWTNVASDATRVYIEAPSGSDQFTAFVKSEFPYSLGLETAAKR